MKNENILDAIGMINDDVIREAKAYKRSNIRLIRSIARLIPFGKYKQGNFIPVLLAKPATVVIK